MTATVRRLRPLAAHCVARLYGKMPIDTPGTWWSMAKGGQVLIRCPAGHMTNMSPKSVTKKGFTGAKFKCSAAECDFHKRLRLEDWR